MFDIGERSFGIGEQLMSAQTSRGRKSATEARQDATFGVGRMKTVSEYSSAVGFAPLGQALIQNSQQFYTAEQKLRIVGNLAGTAGNQFMTVTPEAISGFYEYIPVDGTLPIDRFAQATLWKDIFFQMRQFPDLMAQFDMAKIFMWIAQLAGIRNIDQFRVQVVPDELAAQQAQAGNVIPLQQPRQGLNLPPERPTPRQLPGVGST